MNSVYCDIRLKYAGKQYTPEAEFDYSSVSSGFAMSDNQAAGSDAGR